MATFEIKGLEARAVREHELSEINYDPEAPNITIFGYDPGIARNKPFDGYPKETMPERATREIQEESIKNIIEAASKTFEDPDMTKITVDFGDMLAHLRDSEFLQAFIMGWRIIEKHVSKKWKDGAGSRLASTHKDPKRPPSVGKMLKVLKPTMPGQNYDTFMALKGIRNRCLHEDEQITRQQAQSMLDAVKNHVLKITR